MDRREAFVMKLKPGYEDEYERRHAAIWPELKQLLSDSGVYDYSIFLDRRTLNLFAFQRIRGEGGSQDLGSTEIVKKWWAYMADIMETNPDNSPVSIPLKEVFHMD
ncbi:MAG: L-rhamnose mutarotase [Sphaerochaetaceae bacterium]|nr:L-rhamnose mutarotase [Sphaerochaetaceae bacterium]